MVRSVQDPNVFNLVPLPTKVSLLGAEFTERRLVGNGWTRDVFKLVSLLTRVSLLGAEFTTGWLRGPGLFFYPVPLPTTAWLLGNWSTERRLVFRPDPVCL